MEALLQRPATKMARRRSTRNTPTKKRKQTPTDNEAAPTKKAKGTIEETIDIDEIMNNINVLGSSQSTDEKDEHADEATDKPRATDGITDEKNAAMVAKLDSSDEHERQVVKLAGFTPSVYRDKSKYGSFVFLVIKAIRNNAILIRHAKGTYTCEDFVSIHMSDVSLDLLSGLGISGKPTRDELDEKFKTIKSMTMTVYLKKNKRDYMRRIPSTTH